MTRNVCAVGLGAIAGIVIVAVAAFITCECFDRHLVSV